MIKKKILKIFFVGLLLWCPFFINAQIEENFYVSPDYDIDQREEIETFLLRDGISLYFYVEKDWWNNLEKGNQAAVKIAVRDLDFSFKFEIKPVLNKFYGLERLPGIDNDKKPVILLHQMKDGSIGYFRTVDEYSQGQVASSNEHEMVYLSGDRITDSIAGSYLAHEFTHLITFNQKDSFAVEEETWLNEARAEYASTLVGFNDRYQDSYLEKRVEGFLKEPSDSITEWVGESSDYGALSLFTHYLVEQYGVEILKDSLQSKYIGIKSINKALEKNNIDKTFSEIFTDWTVAIYTNDCSLGKQYCYKSENLKDVKVIPLINFLPLSGRSTLGVTQGTKDWSGNWFKFIGGKGTLKLEFIGETNQSFQIPYIIQGLSGQYSLEFFNLNDFQRGTISIPEFGTEVGSITIIPSIQGKFSDFGDSENSYPFFWQVSTAVEIKEDDTGYLEKPIFTMSRDELLFKVDEIEELLTQLKAQITKIDLEEKEIPVLCQKFEQDLYFGLRGDNIRCLQQFLRTQEGVYPEGLVTGNFFTLTSNAVTRFQEKYSDEILAPLGLKTGTGFVGSSTRDKLNELLGF